MYVMYVSNERKGGLYIDLLMTIRYSHEAWKGRVCSWRTVMKLLEKTHQSNDNLRKNDNVLMPKGEFKLAPNPNPNPARRSGDARVCVVNQA